MPHRNGKLSGLLRQAATEASKQSRLTAKRLKALEALTRRQERAIARLEKIVGQLEARTNRSREQLVCLRKQKQARKRQRRVDHRLSRVEKAHLHEVWMRSKTNPKDLEREGQFLAKRYGLDYKRQVLRWFRTFRRMTQSQLKAISDPR